MDGWLSGWMEHASSHDQRSLVRIHVQGASCGFHVFRVTCPLKMPVNTDPTARGRVESGWNRWKVGGGKGEKVREFRDITRVSSVTRTVRKFGRTKRGWMLIKGKIWGRVSA